MTPIGSVQNASANTSNPAPVAGSPSQLANKDTFLRLLVAQLKTDDAWRISSGGGGGYGSPFERPIEDVREDVRQGYVSVQAAAEKYGVVMDGETFAVDQAATDKLRASKLSTVIPGHAQSA